MNHLYNIHRRVLAQRGMGTDTRRCGGRGREENAIYSANYMGKRHSVIRIIFNPAVFRFPGAGIKS